MKRFVLTIGFLFIISHFYGQTIQHRGNVLTVDSISKFTFQNGDTLSVTIKNLTSQERGFTVEALSLENEPYYYNAVYSAYFNTDTIFFKTLRATQKRSKQMHTRYVLPNYRTNPYNIKANSDTTISFIMKGTPMQKGTMLRLRIQSDIVNDDYETIYSNPILVTSLPD